MDLLSQHEAFLRAIFDAPDDDTPRLVYADFLEENGETEWAEFIRVSCEQHRLVRLDHADENHDAMEAVLSRRVELQRLLAGRRPDVFNRFTYYDRGFQNPPAQVVVPFPLLSCRNILREAAISDHPNWFGATYLSVTDGVLGSGPQIEVLLESQVFAKVTALDLQGKEEYAEPIATHSHESQYFVHVPVITGAGVVALARHRGVRRVSFLDLRNNNLDNDAARALIQSPYLGGLKRLQLLDGNRLRGRVWQQVIERFGEDAVG